ncbi:TonB-dependent receptor plug domain-containing protein [Ideonella sp.]|uniref:TonB-dependent receptor plug domain-containing protein n=1 Tax=Ideonella sp. TaxID=1929293 RepID=UPI0037C15493
MAARTAFRPFILSVTTRASLLALASSLPLAALAQDTAPTQRVEVTGSAIKRIDGESALPVQVITREEINKAGLTTASEILSRISASANNLTDGVSIGTGGFRDQMGFNGANLRGMGVSSTLVLLNGRRLANFASPGDSVGVDLNNIPAAAIQRVEILLDGASALYGSDAIGGVINFITRRDYQGVEVSALIGNTQEGGAGKRSASLAGGWGDFSKDGFNVFGVLDLQSTSRLDTSQRKFISDLKIPERLPHLLSGVPFPANLRLSGLQFDHLESQGFQVNGELISERTINLQGAACNPPFSLPLKDGIAGPQACTYDYMRELELYPKTQKASLFGRGVLDVGGGHQVFAELALTRSNSFYVGTPNRANFEIDYRKIPGLADTGLDSLLAEDDTANFVTVRARLTEAGKRTSELVSNGQRMVLGASGTLAQWDYELGLNRSVNKVSDRDHQGYLIESKVVEGIDSGAINLFGPSSPAGLTAWEAAQYRGEVRRATGTMTSLDVKGSRDLMKLSGGNLALAVGAELRRESQAYYQSPELAADSILGESSQGPDADFRRSRNVSAVWTELSAPLSKELAGC